jgi:catechol 2,3-dioxygenase-like lactoylglutathione lyase family enzyme
MSGRVQLALNVSDIGQAVAFYTRLFGTGPAKLRPGYANFAVADPPFKLVLLENPGQGGTLNHLGIEVPDTGTVDAEQSRLTAAGLASVDKRRRARRVRVLLNSRGGRTGRSGPRAAGS